MNQAAYDKIIKAKIRSQSEQPFFYYLVMNMKIQEMPKEMKMRTMGVDNVGNLYYDVDFVNKLEWNKLFAVLTHETLHVLFEHVQRGKNKQPDVWNICVDLAVNTILKK